MQNTTSGLPKTYQHIYGEAQNDLQNDALLKNVIFLPSDVVSLRDKLQILIGEFIAGNTITRNQIVSILDNLRGRCEMDETEYREISSFVNKDQGSCMEKPPYHDEVPEDSSSEDPTDNSKPQPLTEISSYTWRDEGSIKKNHSVLLP